MNNNLIKKTADTILASINAGILPLPIFNAISQVVVLSPVDLYAFVNTKDGLKIVTSKRPDDDEFLSGNWHIPGKIMTVNDNSFVDTISRVMTDELPGTTMTSEPKQFRSDYQKTLRGKEHVESYWVIVDKLPTDTDGEEIVLANPTDLPTPFLKEQIPRAKEAFALAKNYLENQSEL